MMQVTATRLSSELIYTLISSAISVVLMAVMAMTYTNYVDRKRESSERQNDQQWCDIVKFNDNYYRAHPERITTQEQRDFAALMHARRISLGCDDN